MTDRRSPGGQRWRRFGVTLAGGLLAGLIAACGSSSSSSSPSSSSSATTQSSAAGGSGQSLKNTSFKLGYFITPSVNYYGIINGNYKNLNMGLYSLDSGATGVTLMGAGSLAGSAYVSQPPTVIAFDKHIPVRIVWVEGYEPEYLVVKPGLTNLRGKTLAAQTGGAPQFFLQKTLEAHGISSGGYKYVNLTPPNVVSAYKAGAIDGGVTFPPYSDALFKLGAKPIATGQAYGWDIFTQSFINAHPDVVQAFVCDSMNAQAAFLKNPAAAWQAMAAKLGSTTAAQLKSVMPANSVLPPSQMFSVNGLGSATTVPSLATSSAAQGAWLVQQKVLPSAPTASQTAALIDRQFAQKALQGGCP